MVLFSYWRSRISIWDDLQAPENYEQNGLMELLLHKKPG